MLDTSKIDTTKVLMIHKIQLSFFINKYCLIRVPKNVASCEISIISKQNKYQDDENILFSFLFNENQCVFYYGMNKRSVILTTDENFVY